MNKAVICAILSAILYSISIPVSKIIMQYNVQPLTMGGLSYLGAGIGLLIFSIIKSIFKKEEFFKNPLTKKELPYTVAMVVLDISAITLLMFGLMKTNASNASLLSNFEIVATTLIAYLIFKEKISKKLAFAIGLVVLASVILTFEGKQSLNFSLSSILVLISYCFWGLENNCTKMLSSKNTIEITIIKGIFSGLGSLILANFTLETLPSLKIIFLILFMGFISYGISVSLYIYSQKFIGASKTSAYFSASPYFGAIFSIIFLQELPQIQFYIAFLIMIIATYFITKDCLNG